MGMKLNRRGESYAKGRINRGKIDYDSEWTFSDDERNALFADGAERFREWHLGTDSDHEEDNVAHCRFAYGKDGKVYRAALEGIIREARKLKKKDPGCADIEASAKEMKDLIDRKRENSRRLLFVGPVAGMENEKDPRKAFSGVVLLERSVPLELADGDMTEGGGQRGWTQIARTGSWKGHWQGAFELTEDDLAVMIENHNRFTNRTLFDYGHESVWDSAALASGWGDDMEIGKSGDALYQDTEWTRKASDHIRDGELKYISPVIMFSTIDPYTGEDLGPSIWTVALLNTPFLDGMDPVEIGGQIEASRQLNRGAPPGRQWAIPASKQEPPAPVAPAPPPVALGGQPVDSNGNPIDANTGNPLPTSDTNSSPAPAGTDITPPPEPAPATPDPEPEVVPNTSTPTEDDTMSLKEIALSLGLPETATADEIKTAIATREQEKKQAEQKALQAQQTADESKGAQERVAELEAEKKERELKAVQDLTEAYVKAGRIAPASRERACKMALEDRESFYGLYGKEAEPGEAVVPMGVAPAEPANQVPGYSAAALSDQEQDAISKMRPRLERLAQKRSKRLGKEVTVEEIIAEEKTRRADKQLLGRTFEHPPVKNTTRLG